jgi:hypothetical protein
MQVTISLMLSILGLCSGMVGTVLIYLFGVPRQIDTGGVNVLSLSGDARYDYDEIARIKLFKRRGTIGLTLVGLAFFFQLIALLLDHVNVA